MATTNTGVPLSTEFRIRLAMRIEPAYRIAIRAAVHPSTLSRLLHGAQPVMPQDPRIIAVGRELGLSPAQCFADGRQGVSQKVVHSRRNS